MFRLTNYKKLLRIILILIVTNYQRKNVGSSIEKILENCVTNYYKIYSNNIDNILPLIKLKMINKDKDIIENIKKTRKKNSKTVGTIEINKKNDCLNYNNYFKEMIRNKFF